MNKSMRILQAVVVVVGLLRGGDVSLASSGLWRFSPSGRENVSAVLAVPGCAPTMLMMMRYEYSWEKQRPVLESVMWMRTQWCR
jgi:hypothetical protein